MKKLFSYDGPVVSFLNIVADLVVLNLLWLISCLPVVTIGCATISMHYCCVCLLRGEGKLVSNYWKAFRINFKQSLLIWLLVLVGCGFVALQAILLISYDFMGKTIACICLAVGVIGYSGILCFLFPLQAKFSNTVGNTFYNAIVFSVLNWKTTILLQVLHLLPLIWLIWDIGSFARYSIFWVIIGFSATELLCAKLIEPIWRKTLDEKDQRV